jgi:murein DD-endopeptidase MepM/ murein hydrolase activator NlpD
MSGFVELLCSRRVPQIAALALMSIGFAGCSADVSSRLSQDPFANPFATQQEATGAVPAVERRELPQYSRPQAQPRPISAPQSSPPANPIEVTGSAGPRSVAATRAAGQGTTIIVGTSDTLETLAHRYNVNTAAILQANGYKGPRALSPGQQLIIPFQTPATIAAPASKAVAAAPSVYVVNPGDTLISIARRNHVSLSELAKANNIDTSAKIRLGMKLTVPAAKSAAVPLAVPQANVAAASPDTKVAVAGGPQQSARLAQATTKIDETSAEAPVKAAEATGALPTFRWPVRGKVITSYGAKTNGKANDGINLAVPEGTPVKAAEDGVVAYSGNELKGYGNLVLVRHSNGYVTAYAHASELLVRRGDTIKRGQIIAKSGQSGEVGSPQLHFEIRKGSSPVDPLQFLNGA